MAKRGLTCGCANRCGADEARLQRVLEADTDKKIKAVMVVHNETTTGVTSDIKKVGNAFAWAPSRVR
eukprot:scaffold5608_cov386-Prasinococcus_capsulatus_cf.AAC.4